MALSIQIGADLSQAIQQVKQLSAGLTGLAASSAKVAVAATSLTAIGSAAPAVAAASTAIAAIAPAASTAATALASLAAAAPAVAKLSSSLGAVGNPSAGLSALSAAVVKLKADIAAFPKVPPALPAIPPAATKAATALATIKPGANQAGNALMNLGRVVQDAPFGFIGISNNISPLLESFQRLKAETGTTGGALKALGGSLMGGGGLGIAVAAVTAAVTFAAIGFDRWIPKVAKVSEETKKLADGNNEIVKSLAEETSRIAILVKAIESDTLSKQQRNGAVAELKRLNPDYFGDLKTEKDLIANVGAAYAAYTFNLKEQFKTKALSKQLDDLFDKKLKLEIELDPKAATINDPQFEKERNRLQAEINKLGGLDILPKGPNVDITKLTDAQQKVLKLQSQLDAKSNIRLFDTSGASQQLADINKQIDGLTTRIATVGNFDIPVKDDPKQKKAIDELARRIAQLKKFRDEVDFLKRDENELIDLQINLEIRDQKKNGLDDGQLQRKIESILKNARLKSAIRVPIAIDPSVINVDEFGKATKIINTQLATVGIPLSTSLPDHMRDGTLKALAIAEDFSKAMDTTLTNLRQTAVESIGDAIGTALSGGDMGSVLQNFIASFADALIQLGKTAIGIGIGMEGIRTAIKSLQPGAAIAAGIGLIAVGTLAKSAIKRTAFAEGGVVTGPTHALLGEAGPEVVFPLNKLNAFLQSHIKAADGETGYIAFANLRGSDIELALSRNNRNPGNTRSR